MGMASLVGKRENLALSENREAIGEMCALQRQSGNHEVGKVAVVNGAGEYSSFVRNNSTTCEAASSLR